MRYLNKRNAIITGASRGIGWAIVQKLAKDGCNIWACASRENVEFYDSCKKLAKDNDIWIEPVYFDLANRQEIKEAYSAIVKKDRRIDILINNAGIGHMNLLSLTKTDEIQKIFQVNTLAPIYLTQMVLRNMQRQKSGRIINIASTAATEVYEGNAIYGSTKAALVAFTKSLAAETYRYGVTVNAVAPGLVDTEMSPIFEGKDPKEPLRHSALGRKIHPEEIAQIISELLMDKWKLVNGEVVQVSGGHK